MSSNGRYAIEAAGCCLLPALRKLPTNFYDSEQNAMKKRLRFAQDTSLLKASVLPKTEDRSPRAKGGRSRPCINAHACNKQGELCRKKVETI
jgi:hypothetical protein